MAAGRFGLAALALALASRFAAQGRTRETRGSMPCDTPTFSVLVLGSVVLVGALSFLPALALGPIAEHLHPGTSVPESPRPAANEPRLPAMRS
jgi:K+-transporting ATPase ATPase A chain